MHPRLENHRLTPHSRSLLLLSLALAACSPDRDEVWSSDCSARSYFAILRADGTFEEMGGHGQWTRRSSALHLKVEEHPQIVFESAYPELMSMDGDGVLPFVSEGVLRAERGGFTKHIVRCS